MVLHRDHREAVSATWRENVALRGLAATVGLTCARSWDHLRLLHYDLTPARRDCALRLGARKLTTWGTVAFIRTTIACQHQTSASICCVLDEVLMTIGSRSVLFGAHQFLLHPIMVAIAWTKLYGVPLDPRLWFAFFLHDIGYIGCSDMDGASGERHPERGAHLMRVLFGAQWGEFTLFHSRSYAKAAGRPVSQLCFADKLATALTPACLYLPLVCLTGEIDEYMRNTAQPEGDSFHSAIGARTGDVGVWFAELRDFNQRWVQRSTSAAILPAPLRAA